MQVFPGPPDPEDTLILIISAIVGDEIKKSRHKLGCRAKPPIM